MACLSLYILCMLICTSVPQILPEEDRMKIYEQQLTDDVLRSKEIRELVRHLKAEIAQGISEIRQNIEELQTVLEGKSTDDSADSCLSGSQSIDEGCIYISNTEATWAGALAYCQTKGGHLVYLETAQQQSFLREYLVLHYIEPQETVIQLSTTKVYRYRFLHDMGVDVTGHTSLTFQVKACNDAHIALSQDKGVDSRNTYEVVIGGWSGRRSVIRDCKQCAYKARSNKRQTVNCKTYLPFWIGWENGIIRVGTGNVVGNGQFMMWNDAGPHDVNYVAVSTGFGSNGDWKFNVGNYWPGQFWLGLLAVAGEWMWLPERRQLEYSNWGLNEPDNPQTRQHCALVDLHRNYTWSDDNCKERRNFVCQIDV